MRCQTQLAGMRRQCALLARRMLDRMRPDRQLGEDEDRDKQEMTQGIHDDRLINLDEQAFEVLALGKVQGNGMIGRARQTAHDARLTPGIDG